MLSVRVGLVPVVDVVVVRVVLAVVVVVQEITLQCVTTILTVRSSQSIGQLSKYTLSTLEFGSA